MNTLLSHDMLQTIGSFLDYNSRINYNLCLSHKDQYMKRLESDAHNLQVITNHLSLLLIKIDDFEGIPSKQSRIILKVFKYLATTRDTLLFQIKHPTFREILYTKINEFCDKDTYTDTYISPYIEKTIKRACNKVRIKLDTIPATKMIKGNIIRVV